MVVKSIVMVTQNCGFIVVAVVVLDVVVVAPSLRCIIL